MSTEIENKEEEVVESQETAPETEETGDITHDDQLSEAESEVVAAPDSAEQPVEAAETEKTWEPSFKFKVKDEEFEMEDWVKPFVTDEETHKKFQALFSAGRGIEDIKTERASLREEVSAMRQEKESLDASLATLSDFVQKGNMREFFDSLGIPRDKVLRYALEELKYQELPPEKRQEIEMQRAQQAHVAQLEMQNQQIQQQWQTQAIEQRERELGLVMSDPTISQVAQEYDARVGKTGAFKEEVIRRGQYYDSVHGQDIPAKQAVEEVLSLIGGGAASTPGQAVGTSQVDQNRSNVVTPRRNKPTMTNVQGTSMSPAKKAYTSVDQLRKRQQELAEQGL